MALIPLVATDALKPNDVAHLLAEAARVGAAATRRPGRVRARARRGTRGGGGGSWRCCWAQRRCRKGRGWCWGLGWRCGGPGRGRGIDAVRPATACAARRGGGKPAGRKVTKRAPCRRPAGSLVTGACAVLVRDVVDAACASAVDPASSVRARATRWGRRWRRGWRRGWIGGSWGPARPRGRCSGECGHRR